MYNVELLNFLHLVSEEELKFCILCWRTSKDRTLVNTTDLIALLKYVDNKCIKPSIEKHSVCCYCNSYVKRAINVMKNWCTSSRLISFINSLSKSETSTFFKSVDNSINHENNFNNLSLHKWRFDTVKMCNARLPTMRAFSDLVVVPPETHTIVEAPDSEVTEEGSVQGSVSTMEQYMEMAKTNTNMTVSEDDRDFVIIENSIDNDSTESDAVQQESIIIIEDGPVDLPEPITIKRTNQLKQTTEPIDEDLKVLVIQKANNQLAVHPIYTDNDIKVVPSLKSKIFDHYLSPLTVVEKEIFNYKAQGTKTYIINGVDIDLITKTFNTANLLMFEINFNALNKFIQPDTKNAINLQNNILFLNKNNINDINNQNDLICESITNNIKPNRNNKVKQDINRNKTVINDIINTQNNLINEYIRTNIKPNRNNKSKQNNKRIKTINNTPIIIKPNDDVYKILNKPKENKNKKKSVRNAITEQETVNAVNAILLIGETDIQTPIAINAEDNTITPQPILSNNVDWEAKIPMEVISYKDAVDPCPDKIINTLNDLSNPKEENNCVPKYSVCDGEDLIYSNILSTNTKDPLHIDSDDIVYINDSNDIVYINDSNDIRNVNGPTKRSANNNKNGPPKYRKITKAFDIYDIVEID